MIEEAVQNYLSDRTVAVGETVQFGWLIFRIFDVGPPVIVESLDFRKVASFTKDLSEADRIHRRQLKILKAYSLKPEMCTLRHSAIVSKSYTSTHPNAFIKRDAAVKGHDSGWYLGILDDPLDINDPTSYNRTSLYELSISDKRLSAYWLMPVGTVVSLEKGIVGLMPNHSLNADARQDTPSAGLA